MIPSKVPYRYNFYTDGIGNEVFRGYLYLTKCDDLNEMLLIFSYLNYFY